MTNYSAAALAARRARPILSLEERFWRFVEPEPMSGCWLWTGRRLPHGYGQMTLGKRGSYVTHYAHRLSWELHNGPIRGSQYVLHHCDTPPCVRPSHLFLGNQAANMWDMVKKDRWGNQYR